MGNGGVIVQRNQVEQTQLSNIQKRREEREQKKISESITWERKIAKEDNEIGKHCVVCGIMTVDCVNIIDSDSYICSDCRILGIQVRKIEGRGRNRQE